MISFRYHIVSIVAVFLALALGVVIGTTGLNGAILDDLHKQVRDLRGENNTMRTANDTLQTQVNNGDRFASAYGARILAGTLPAVAVDIITAPGASSDDADKIAQDVAAAGGTVAGRIDIDSAYVDPASRQKITDFVNSPSVHPADLDLPPSTDPGVLAGATLAFVLAGKSKPSEFAGVLAGFATLNMVHVSGSSPKAATAAVIVTGGAVAGDDGRSKALPALASELNSTGIKTVVAGDDASATESGLVAAVRDDSSLSGTVSTVDNTTSAIGQVSAVLALVGLQSNQVGHYGTGAKATALFPTLK